MRSALTSFTSGRAVARSLALLTLLSSTAALAQGDGPKAQLMMPVDANLVAPTYIDLSGNYNPSGSILVPGAEVKPTLGVLSYKRSFALGGRYAEFWLVPIYGDIEATGTVADPRTGETVALGVDSSGLGDPLVAFKLGLVGTQPMTLPELARTPQSFQLSAFVSASLPLGDYDSDRPLNIGTNVLALRFGAPMVVPLGDPRTQTFLEIHPSVTFFEDNDDPNLGADTREQDLLFAVESHLSRLLSRKFWGSLDLRYRRGGETTTDGVSDDNEQDVLGGGVTLGYAITPRMGLQVSYGEVLTENDGSELEMIRLKWSLLF